MQDSITPLGTERPVVLSGSGSGELRRIGNYWDDHIADWVGDDNDDMRTSVEVGETRLAKTRRK